MKLRKFIKKVANNESDLDYLLDIRVVNPVSAVES